MKFNNTRKKRNIPLHLKDTAKIILLTKKLYHCMSDKQKQQKEAGAAAIYLN